MSLTSLNTHPLTLQELPVDLLILIGRYLANDPHALAHFGATCKKINALLKKEPFESFIQMCQGRCIEKQYRMNYLSGELSEDRYFREIENIITKIKQFPSSPLLTRLINDMSLIQFSKIKCHFDERAWEEMDANFQSEINSIQHPL